MIKLSVPLKNRYGLHARPSQVLAATAAKFSSEVTIEWHGERLDAKSVLNLISLGIRSGNDLAFIIEGTDEVEAANEIEMLVVANFGLQE
jgi:phosphocarrier protein